MLQRHHVVERTSPKGPGEQFIGRCVLCGMRNLVPSDALRYCENIVGVTTDEALIKAVTGLFPEEQ